MKRDIHDLESGYQETWQKFYNITYTLENFPTKLYSRQQVCFNILYINIQNLQYIIRNPDL